MATWSACASPGTPAAKEVTKMGFNIQDVVGADQGKLDCRLQEVTDFLENPQKYTVLGPKMPKGCVIS
jgi:ATP-dependent Zn protease